MLHEAGELKVICSLWFVFLFSKDYFVLFSVQKHTFKLMQPTNIFQSVAFSSIRFSISIVHKCFISWRNTWNISYSFFYLPLRKRRNIIDNNLSRDDPGQSHCCTVKHGEAHGWIVRSVRERCLKVSLSATIIGMSPSVSCVSVDGDLNTKKTMVFGYVVVVVLLLLRFVISRFPSSSSSLFYAARTKRWGIFFSSSVWPLSHAFHSLTDENLLSKSVGRSVGRSVVQGIVKCCLTKLYNRGRMSPAPARQNVRGHRWTT